MINLKRLRLRNVVTYSDVELQLDEHPLVVIGGRNRDSQIAHNFNGVGKSVLFGTLPNMLYESDPLALTRRSKANMLAGDSEIEFEWEFGDTTIVAKQTSKKYHIEINGEDQEVHKSKQEVGRNWIAKMFPMPENAFYSYVYLHSQRSHVFQRAKPAERMHYLTELFDFGIYDKLRTYFGTKVNEAKKAAGDAEIIAAELQVHQAELKALAFNPKELKAAQQELESLNSQLVGDSGLYERSNKLRLLGMQLDAKEALVEKITELVGPDMTPALAEKALQELDEASEQIVAYNRYRELYAEYRDRVLDYDEKLAGLTTDTTDYSHEIEALDAELTKLENQISEARDDAALLSELETEFEDCVNDLEALTAPDRDLEYYESEAAAARPILKVYDQFADAGKRGTCDCPTCRQTVDLKELRALARDAEKKIHAFQDASAYFELAAKHNKLASEIAELRKTMQPIKPLKARAAKLSARIDEITDISAQQSRRASIEERKAELKRPAKVQKPKTDITRQEIKRQVSNLQRYLQLAEQLAENTVEGDVDELARKYKVIQRKIKTIEADRVPLSDKVSELTAAGKQAVHLGKQCERITNRLAELQPVIDNLKLYTAMHKAYAPTNLKSSAVEGVLIMIEDTLNDLSPLTFPEPFKFGLSIKNGGVEAKVTRPNGLESDIQNLSGAEGNCFALLWALVMLVFTPEDRRPNFIILDEPEKACSPGVRDHLVREFLPKLMDIVPHVFWITPLGTDIFGDVPRWIIEKHNGVSQVIVE